MNKRVNFEIAKLLKEKGYDKPTSHQYSNDKLTNHEHTNNFMQRFRYSAPTIAEVVMWLYEKHGIWIVSIPELFNGTEVKYYPSLYEQGIGEDIEEYFNSPTEAYGAAIEYVLTNLI